VTLSSYLARQFMQRFVGVLLAVLAIVLLLDLVELLRRAASKPDATLGLLINMAFLKLPRMTQLVLPFVILFSGILTFWKLTRTNELTVARATGVSVWQFIRPAILTAIAIGAIKVMLFSPLTSATSARYELLEDRYLRSGSRQLSVASNGIWLRQSDRVGQSVIHAARVSVDQTEMHDVMIFFYGQEGDFSHRIDAASARLVQGYWQLQGARVSIPDRPAEFYAEFSIETDLTPQKIQDSFAAPETISFWSLPNFIQVLEQAGFSALRHRIYLQSLLASPLLLAAMVLIAAAFSMRPARRGGVALMIISGAGIGFLLYFLSDLVMAFGLSGAIPVSLAAWTPAIVGMLAGLSALIFSEEG
jgi:lipopolysaccharide export system permease protein